MIHEERCWQSAPRANAMQALSTNPRPEEIMAGMGTRFFVSETGIKTFSVGYPNLVAMLSLRMTGIPNSSSGGMACGSRGTAAF